MIVVIGGGDAGISAALSASKYEKVILISEKEEFCPKCPLPIFLAGRIKEEDLVKRVDKFFLMNKNVELVFDKAIKIDRERKMVLTEKGRQVKYDKLIIATGALPYIAEIKNKKGRINTFSSIEDAKLLKKVRKGDKVIVVGAGAIGCELASVLNGFGADISVFEEKEHIMNFLSKEFSSMVEKKLSEKGIKFYKNARIEEIKKNIVIFGGRKIEFDYIVFCTGIKANAELAREAGLEVGRGVRVDPYLRTSDEDIFAAGDCAEYKGGISGLGSVAERQGYIAGLNAAGKKIEFNVVHALSSKIGEIEVAKVGALEGFKGSAVRGEMRLNLFFNEEGIFTGAECFGERTSYFIDALSIALQKKAVIKDLLCFNYTYHPLLSDAPNIINIAAENARRRMEVKKHGIN